MNRLSSISELDPKYYNGSQYDLKTLCKVIKYAAKLELGNPELDDFDIDVIITCMNFVKNNYERNLLNDEDVIKTLSSEDTIEKMYLQINFFVRDSSEQYFLQHCQP